MEQQKLPNATTSIVLGSISFLCCCFSMGIGGLILSGIALFLTKKDEKLYAEQPDLYSNFNQAYYCNNFCSFNLVKITKIGRAHV